MNTEALSACAATLHQAWLAQDRLAGLPAELVPPDVASAYRAQAALIARFADPHGLRGWKIAATSVAGQRHIGVSGPLAGRLMQHRVLPDGAQVPLAEHGMRVAEAEFTLELGRALPEQSTPWREEQVLACLSRLYPGIESPDSRFIDFAQAGECQLIAENSCADWFVLGAAAPDSWRGLNLAAHRVQAWRNGEQVADGLGERVLGGPLRAATWLANALAAQGLRWQPGEVVATGTCLVPVPVVPGDHIRMDFGALGSVEARFQSASSGGRLAGAPAGGLAG